MANSTTTVRWKIWSAMPGLILAREMRHSILKITGSETEKDIAPVTIESDSTPTDPAPPTEEPLNTSEELHERHVIVEHHEHAPTDEQKR